MPVAPMRVSGLTPLAGVLALVFFIIVVLLYKSAQASDSELALLMNVDRGTAFTAVMIAASRYGRDYFWAGIVTVMFMFGKKETKLDAIELAILLVAGVLAGDVLKHFIYKPRPFETLMNIVTRIPKEYNSTFPSGHALTVTIGATFGLLKFHKKSIALALTFEASVVAYSRAYLGMHFPLDVMAGMCIGAAIAFLGVLFMDRRLELLLEKITCSKSNPAESLDNAIVQDKRTQTLYFLARRLPGHIVV
jgi:membrane-associated phospholipid phosphatase